MKRVRLAALLVSIALLQSAHAVTESCPPIANPNITCQPHAPPADESTPARDSRLVVYVFSYTCPPCADVDAFVRTWSKRSDVPVLHSPAVWNNDRVRQMAAAYYAFERLGVAETLGPRLFAALKSREYSFGGPDELARFAESYGVRGDLVKRALASPRTSFKVAIAEQRVRKYRLDGVPFLMVNDRYGLGLKSADPQTLADLGVLLDALAAEP